MSFALHHNECRGDDLQKNNNIYAVTVTHSVKTQNCIVLKPRSHLANDDSICALAVISWIVVFTENSRSFHCQYDAIWSIRVLSSSSCEYLFWFTRESEPFFWLCGGCVLRQSGVLIKCSGPLCILNQHQHVLHITLFCSLLMWVLIFATVDFFLGH